MNKQHITYIELQLPSSSLLYRLYSEHETATISHLSIGALRYLRTLGLVEGQKTDGQWRYNEAEVMQLRQIRRLQHDLGINLAGVEVILRLLKRLESIHQELEQEKKRADRQVKESASMDNY